MRVAILDLGLIGGSAALALKARGYTRAGQTYRKTQGHATAHLTLMRYTGAHAGHFDVRMSPKAAGRQVYLEGKCRAG